MVQRRSIGPCSPERFGESAGPSGRGPHRRSRGSENGSGAGLSGSHSESVGLGREEETTGTDFLAGRRPGTGAGAWEETGPVDLRRHLHVEGSRTASPGVADLFSSAAGTRTPSGRL